MAHKLAQSSSFWMLFSTAIAGALVVAVWAQDETPQVALSKLDEEITEAVEEEISVSFQIDQKWAEKQEQWESKDAETRRQAIESFEEENATLLARQLELEGKVIRKEEEKRKSLPVGEIILRPIVDSEEGREHANLQQFIDSSFFILHETDLSAEEKRRAMEELSEELSSELDLERRLHGSLLLMEAKNASPPEIDLSNPSGLIARAVFELSERALSSEERRRFLEEFEVLNRELLTEESEKEAKNILQETDRLTR